MCGIDVKEKRVCRNSTHWKNVRNLSFDFPARTTVWKNVRKFVAANSTHAKCEEIEDGLGKCEETPFLTSEDVRKYSKSFLAIKFQCEENVRNFFSTCVEKSIWATETKKNPLGEFFRIWIFFYHVRVWCSGDLS